MITQMMRITDDVWILAYEDPSTIMWTELYMAEAWPRFWHKAEYIKSEQEVMVVGGHIVHVSPLNDTFSSPILLQNFQVTKNFHQRQKFHR